MRNDDGNSSAGAGWEDSGFALHGNGGGLCSRIDGNGLDSILSEIQSIPNPEKVGNPQQSHVQDGYWETLAETATGITKDGVRSGAVVSVGEITLETLIPKAMRAIDEILDTPLDQSDPNFARLLSAKKDAAVATLNTATKTDENRFRQRKNNILEDLLTRMRLAEKQSLVIEAAPAAR